MMTDTPCPVAPLAREAGRIIQELDTLDVPGGGLPTTQDEQRRSRRLFWRLETLMDMAAESRATSFEGALFQIAVLKDYHFDLLDALPAPDAPGLDPVVQHAIRGKRDRALACLYSLADFLQREGSVSGKDVGIPYHFPPSSNPLQDLAAFAA